MPPETPRAGGLAYAAYDAVGAVAAVLAVPLAPLWLWYGYGNGLAQRLGMGLPARATRLAARPIWIHAASVGEVRAARPLVEEIRRRRPQLPIVLSTTTVTGRAVAQTDLAPDIATLLPVDPLRIIDRALAAVRPRCIVVAETEIWPGFFRAARRLNIPLAVVSGRISPRATARYRRITSLMREALGCVAAFGMQTQPDADRIISLGAPPERVRVTGSLKAGPVTVTSIVAPLEGIEARRMLIAASTQPGEERFVLTACASLWRRHPDMLLLLAPRRPERFDEVAALLGDAGVSFVRRTAMSGRIEATTRVLLLDTVGDLVRYLPFTQATFVGGTIAPLGGHNVLEPATYGTPVAFGPSTENVAEPANALLEEHAAQRVQTPDDLSQHWMQVLDDPDGARAMGERARAVASAGAAAREHTWHLLEPFLGEA